MSDLAAWGIDPGYHDFTWTWRDAPAASLDAILASMGAEPGATPPAPTSWIVRQGETVRVPAGSWQLRYEDGGSEAVAGELTRELPLGYHSLVGDERAIDLVVTPGRCFLPPDLRAWGWAAQLYALRSYDSWGIGDLADLRRLGDWTGARSGSFLLVNPLHAALPGEPQESSPYSPSSRCFRNPLYLRVEDVPGASAVDGLDTLAEEGRRLNDDRRVDHDAVYFLKITALEEIWRGFPGDPAFDAFLEAGGRALHDYAVFCTLSEVHGRGWRTWPAEFRHPRSGAVATFADERIERVLFHAWMQWLLDEQLRRAGERVGVMQDLAIGAHPDGADVWMWQDVFADGVRVGAPPDEFNTQGQDWGLPPFDPWRLRAAGYKPFIETLRAGFRHAGGLRFDHVMGLFRLYWIPPEAGAGDGTYVQYPANDLLGLLALESHRAGAYVVGEDLGTVTDAARAAMAEADILSYRLAWFEPNPPSAFPAKALGAITTHDLPTVAGLFSGSDLARQQDLGVEPNAEATVAMVRRVAGFVDAAEDTPAPEVADRLHRAIAESPTMLVTATIEDALGVEERPNHPGTVVPENWSTALPVPLDDLLDDERFEATAALLSAGRAAPSAVAEDPR